VSTSPLTPRKCRRIAGNNAPLGDDPVAGATPRFSSKPRSDEELSHSPRCADTIDFPELSARDRHDRERYHRSAIERRSCSTGYGIIHQRTCGGAALACAGVIALAVGPLIRTAVWPGGGNSGRRAGALRPPRLGTCENACSHFRPHAVLDHARHHRRRKCAQLSVVGSRSANPLSAASLISGYDVRTR
jgi:hypothetical protein